MKLLITTQVYENYAWNEDGSIGVGKDSYWKAKGSNDYVVTNFKDSWGVTETIMVYRDQVEQDNDYIREQIIDWAVVKDDYLTQFERDQLEYQGKITCPTTELNLHKT